MTSHKQLVPYTRSRGAPQRGAGGFQIGGQNVPKTVPEGTCKTVNVLHVPSGTRNGAEMDPNVGVAGDGGHASVLPVVILAVILLPSS